MDLEVRTRGHWVASKGAADGVSRVHGNIRKPRSVVTGRTESTLTVNICSFQRI